MFLTGNRPQMAEWVFDPRRRHATPADDNAARLCLSGSDRPAGRLGGDDTATATVTPIARRLGSLTSHAEQARAEPERQPARAAQAASAGAPASGAPAAQAGRKDAATGGDQPEVTASPARERPARKAAGGRSRRASVPSWDEIMLGNSRPPD